MADERKKDPTLDDWNSLPLDPTADDWDDEPAKPGPTAEPGPADEPAKPAEPAKAAAPDKPADDWDEAPAEPDKPTEPGQAAEPDKPAEPGQAAEPDEPAEPGQAAEPDKPAEPGQAAEPGEPAEPGQAAEPDKPADADEAPGPAAPPEDQASESASEAEAPGTSEAAPGGPAGEEDNSEAAGADQSDEAPEPLPQKVELDIEGGFLEDLASMFPKDSRPEQPEAQDAPEAPKPAAPPPPKTAPAPKPAQPPLEPPPKPRSRLKFLALLPPILMLLGGLGWFAHQHFNQAPPPPPPVLVIDPTVPPRGELEPGEMLLKPFYINFAGQPETIVEMTVMLYYNDTPDRELIEANLPVVREVVFRLTRNKGRQVVTNANLQRALRRELVKETNAALGAEAVSYIQLTQFRILH